MLLDPLSGSAENDRFMAAQFVPKIWGQNHPVGPGQGGLNSGERWKLAQNAGEVRLRHLHLVFRQTIVFEAYIANEEHIEFQSRKNLPCFPPLLLKFTSRGNSF